MRATKPANNSILRLRTVVSTLSESVLRSALASDRMWSSRLRFRQPRHRRRIWWWTFGSLSYSALLGLHVTHPYRVASREPRLSASAPSGVNASNSDGHIFPSYAVRSTPMPWIRRFATTLLRSQSALIAPPKYTK